MHRSSWISFKKINQGLEITCIKVFLVEKLYDWWISHFRIESS